MQHQSTCCCNARQIYAYETNDKCSAQITEGTPVQHKKSVYLLFFLHAVMSHSTHVLHRLSLHLLLMLPYLGKVFCSVHVHCDHNTQSDSSVAKKIMS